MCERGDTEKVKLSLLGCYVLLGWWAGLLFWDICGVVEWFFYWWSLVWKGLRNTAPVDCQWGKPRCGEIIQMASPPLKNVYAHVIINNTKIKMDKRKFKTKNYLKLKFCNHLATPTLGTPALKWHCMKWPDARILKYIVHALSVYIWGPIVHVAVSSSAQKYHR